MKRERKDNYLSQNMSSARATNSIQNIITASVLATKPDRKQKITDKSIFHVLRQIEENEELKRPHAQGTLWLGNDSQYLRIQFVRR
jgi:hypothetical protein